MNVQKFKKKPVEIEAVLYDGYNGAGLAEWCKGKEAGVLKNIKDRNILIPTLEGEMTASFGDYIIKGVEGEYYPCKPKIFLKTYHPVESSVGIKESEDSDEVVAYITEQRFEELDQAEKLLMALQAAGVDNWDGYDFAIDILNEGEDE